MTLPPDVNEGINQALEGSVRGDAVPYEGISSPAVTRDCPNRGRDLSSNSSAAKIEVAPQGVAGVSAGCEPMRASQTKQGQDLTANGGRNQFARSCENTADSQALEVAGQGKANSLRIGSLCVGDEGGEVPAKISPLPEIELLSDFNDEGETGWNAQRRIDMAKKMQRIAAGGYNSVDKLIDRVEELAEVGQ